MMKQPRPRAWKFVVVPFLLSLGLTRLSSAHLKGEACTIEQKEMDVVGRLTPLDLPPPTVFQFDEKDRTRLTLPGTHEIYDMATARVQRRLLDAKADHEIKDSTTTRSSMDAAANVTHIANLMDRETARRVRDVLTTHPTLDEDPDTVDGMTTYEIFIDSPDLSSSSNVVRDDNTIKVLNVQDATERATFRRGMQSILRPILEHRITPLVRYLYGDEDDACGSHDPHRACTPCYSLIRRYRTEDRVSHATHHDGHAIATVVVSLSDFGIEYRGGLYVATGYGQKRFVPLMRGDAVVHKSTLLHGVQVLELDDADASKQQHNTTSSERWSWIIWYRDSHTCEDHSYEWFVACADAGDAACQQLHATTVGNIPNQSTEVTARRVLHWNTLAAENGNGIAAVKMARAYLKLLPADVPHDENEAIRYYQLAIQSQEPDGHYGMAGLLLWQLQKQRKERLQSQQPYSSSSSSSSSSSITSLTINETTAMSTLRRVVYHLEAAAKLGHAYAMFNLGMVHTYGYGISQINTTLAVEWFIASSLPEGYYVSYFQAASVGDQKRMNLYQQRAQALGMNQPWRKQARQYTGSGGAAGVDLNLPWPPSVDGRQPPVL